MMFPDRIDGLIKRLEAGENVTQKDVNKLATLQVLDLAKLGEDFTREAIAREEQQTADLQASLKQNTDDLANG